MSTVRYEVVEHDGGWAYKVGDVPLGNLPLARGRLKAATDAAARQTVAGSTDGIVYQDRDGRWHEEVADGRDRPSTEVVDDRDPPPPQRAVKKVSRTLFFSPSRHRKRRGLSERSVRR